MKRRIGGSGMTVRIGLVALVLGGCGLVGAMKADLAASRAEDKAFMGKLSEGDYKYVGALPSAQSDGAHVDVVPDFDPATGKMLPPPGKHVTDAIARAEQFVRRFSKLEVETNTPARISTAGIRGL